MLSIEVCLISVYSLEISSSSACLLGSLLSRVVSSLLSSLVSLLLSEFLLLSVMSELTTDVCAGNVVGETGFNYPLIALELSFSFLFS